MIVRSAYLSFGYGTDPERASAQKAEHVCVLLMVQNLLILCVPFPLTEVYALAPSPKQMLEKSPSVLSS